MKIQNPHDKFFKESMGNAEVAKDFLANYLPESVLQIIDLSFSHRYPIPTQVPYTMQLSYRCIVNYILLFSCC
ncbi:Rpn family recombination-promoting nuclease/putative transposase [Mammaliicoccus sciuri]|uniref:Rpn family recombination-promoting nuclease/putative transposase n=1 Tax=Sporosarcina sp. FSL K6-3508 TaxID=2921557 RepID=UPI0031599AEE